MPAFRQFFSSLFRPSAQSSGDQAIKLTAGLPVPANATDAAPARALGARLSQMHETDNNFYPGSNLSSMYRDRYDYDRQTILAECLRAWRMNPLARRIVKLISMFIVGEGIQVKSDHKATKDYLGIWWDHPLNRLGRKCVSFCDEATRSGNLFFLCTVDQANGMLYVRGVPADQVDEIISAPNDIDQEIAYKPTDQAKEPWPAFDRTLEQPFFMLHYAYNQPVGVAWGEPDLAPMLPWLGRYVCWLEDRARLNHFRQAFLYVVNGTYADRAAMDARQRELQASPPPSGSILVTGQDETWSVINPELDSKDAGEDGLALKKMIALGAGVPTHYLAEPESSTRTTAEAAGTPTFRGLEQTQQYFLDILTEIAEIAVQHRKLYDRRVNPTSEIEAVGPDITERDNSLLSLAVSRIYPALIDLYDRKGITEDEVIRLTYRMAGESAPPPAPGDMQRRPLKPIGRTASAPTNNQNTGDESEAGVNPP
jgi:hypothetical protein